MTAAWVRTGACGAIFELIFLVVLGCAAIMGPATLLTPVAALQAVGGARLYKPAQPAQPQATNGRSRRASWSTDPHQASWSSIALAAASGPSGACRVPSAAKSS